MLGAGFCLGFGSPLGVCEGADESAGVSVQVGLGLGLGVGFGLA